MTAHAGQTAIVTGASSGIGRVIAEALAQAGFTVSGTSRRASANGPVQIVMLPCDVTDDESVQALVADVLSQTGRIDVLVNNAGIGLIGGAEESSIAQVQALFDVNLFGTVRMINMVLPSMRRRGQGRIINIGSILGLIPAPYSTHHSATKHALEGYSESLDHEVRAFGVRASLIEPGNTRSGFEQNALEPDAMMAEYDRARSDAVALMKDMVGTGDDPQVVADAVLKAVTDARPRRRYAAGKRARQVSLLRRFVPAEMFDKSLRKQMRLPMRT